MNYVLMFGTENSSDVKLKFLFTADKLKTK